MRLHFRQTGMFGGGLLYQTGNFSLVVDYAYKYMGILGPTHFISFSLGW